MEGSVCDVSLFISCSVWYYCFTRFLGGWNHHIPQPHPTPWFFSVPETILFEVDKNNVDDKVLL